MGKDELVAAAVDAFEESTGQPANDYELAVIKAAAEEMAKNDERKQG